MGALEKVLAEEKKHELAREKGLEQEQGVCELDQGAGQSELQGFGAVRGGL